MQSTVGEARPAAAGRDADGSGAADIPRGWQRSRAKRAHRDAWRRSAEARAWVWVAITVVSAAVVLGGLLGAANPEIFSDSATSFAPSRAEAATLAATSAVTFVSLYVLPFVRIAFRRRFTNNVLLAQSLGELAKAEVGLRDDIDNTEFSALWTVTQKRLDYYHTIATSQSRRSFTHGQVAAGLGLVIVLGCAGLALLADTTAGSVTAGILGAAGAALSGYVGTTFMKSQELASQQLRAYFAQPLELSRFLAAERLLDSIKDPAARESATAELVLEIARPSPGAREAREGSSPRGLRSDTA